MTNARDIIRGARRDLHGKLGIPANYYPDDNGPATPIHVRLTDHLPAVANPEQSRFGLADVETVSPKLLFMVSECDPDAGATVALYGGDVYRILAEEVRHDISVTVECIRLKDVEAANYPAPEA